MNIEKAFPPNIDRIHEVIDSKYTQHACFTYGNIIYNPTGNYIDEPLGLHEAQHSLQQEECGGAEFWWERWLTDKRFRYEQEASAYGVQYRRYCELERHRNKRAVYLFRLASDLSSPQYGSVVSLMEARKRIAEWAPPV